MIRTFLPICNVSHMLRQVYRLWRSSAFLMETNHISTNPGREVRWPQGVRGCEADLEEATDAFGKDFSPVSLIVSSSSVN
jgi:hypothetical protein